MIDLTGVSSISPIMSFKFMWSPALIDHRHFFLKSTSTITSSGYSKLLNQSEVSVSSVVSHIDTLQIQQLSILLLASSVLFVFSSVLSISGFLFKE